MIKKKRSQSVVHVPVYRRQKPRQRTDVSWIPASADVSWIPASADVLWDPRYIGELPRLCTPEFQCIQNIRYIMYLYPSDFGAFGSTVAHRFWMVLVQLFSHPESSHVLRHISSYLVFGAHSCLNCASWGNDCNFWKDSHKMAPEVNHNQDNGYFLLTYHITIIVVMHIKLFLYIDSFDIFFNL